VERLTGGLPGVIGRQVGDRGLIDPAILAAVVIVLAALGNWLLLRSAVIR
jgi:hypothetical protein